MSRIFQKTCITMIFMVMLPSIDAQTVHEEIDAQIEKAIEYNSNRELLDIDTLLMSDILKKAEKLQYHKGIFLALRSFGDYYSRVDRNIKAIEFYQSAQIAIEQLEDNFMPKSYLALRIANCYHTAGRIDKAEKLFNELLENLQLADVSKNQSNEFQVLKIQVMMTLGFAQIDLKKTDEGMSNQLKAYGKIVPELYKDHQHYLLEKSRNGFNLAYSYLVLGDGKKAMPFLEKYHQFLLSYSPNSKDLAQSYGNLAYCHSLLKNYKQAYKLYDLSLTLSNENGFSKVSEVTYKDLSDTYRADGKFELAIENLERHYTIKDSLIGIKRQYDLNQLEVKHKSELKEQEIIRLRQVNQIKDQENLLIGAGLLVVTMLSTFIIGFLVNQRKRRKEKSLVQKLQLKSTQKELSFKKQDISKLAIEYTKQQDINEVILNKLSNFEQSISPSEKQNWQSLLRNIKNHLHLYDDQKIFKENIESINHAFYHQLTKQYPDLSQSEKELCSFIRLGKSNKEIASFRSVTPEAVRTSRFRLRKKLKMDSKNEVEIFLKNLVQ